MRIGTNEKSILDCVMIINGFSFAAVSAGLRYKNRLDLGLIVCDQPAVTAGMFTTNQVKAAPVLLDIERLKQGKARAILVNSGSANACTGEIGMADAHKTCGLAAQHLGIDENEVLVASTGVIGERLKVAGFEAHMGELVAGLRHDGAVDVARAMMTTDTVEKSAFRTIELGGEEVAIGGLAKGSGMIMPNMATMLAFVMTDARISFPQLRHCLKNSVAASFNLITVDGDTSTNDMVLVMASGHAGNRWIEDVDHPDCHDFGAALAEVLDELAEKIVADGEGATKLVRVAVGGAKDDHEAEQMARTVANSSLVKTAFFGGDPNWGRIVAAMGRAGVRFRPELVDIACEGIMLVRGGVWVGEEAETQVAEAMRAPRFTVSIDLHQGSGAAAVRTCDLSYDYIKINADYRS